MKKEDSTKALKVIETTNDSHTQTRKYYLFGILCVFSVEVKNNGINTRGI